MDTRLRHCRFRFELGYDSPAELEQGQLGLTGCLRSWGKVINILDRVEEDVLLIAWVGRGLQRGR